MFGSKTESVIDESLCITPADGIVSGLMTASLIERSSVRSFASRPATSFRSSSLRSDRILFGLCFFLEGITEALCGLRPLFDDDDLPGMNVVIDC